MLSFQDLGFYYNPEAEAHWMLSLCLQCDMRKTHLGFCLKIIVNEKRKLEKTTSTVPSILLYIYGLKQIIPVCCKVVLSVFLVFQQY